LSIRVKGNEYQYTDNDAWVYGTFWYKVAPSNPFGVGTFSNTASAYITASGPVTLSLTITATQDTKIYDGTTSSLATPTVTGSVSPGDDVDLIQYYNQSLIGTSSLDPTASLTVASENLYEINFVPAQGIIQGPSKNPDFIIIPVSTDLPWNDGWFISVPGLGNTGSIFLCQEELPDDGIQYTLTSSNAISWSIVSTSSYDTNTSVIYTRKFAFNDSGRCLGVGDEYPSGIIYYYYTDDYGVTWTSGSIPGLSYRPSDIIWDGTKWVGCAQAGTIITSSTDGTLWSIESTGDTEEVYRLLFVSGTYYATSGQIGGFSFTSNGYIWTSTDCKTWTARSSSQWSPGSAPAYWDIAYSPTLNMFMAVGDASNDYGIAVVTSSNGIEWGTASLPPLVQNITLTAVTWNSDSEYFADTSKDVGASGRLDNKTNMEDILVMKEKYEKAFAKYRKGE
jgi:hypothetical protein